ncbi:MAG: dUTP diphosphatase [Actinomycetota bacterium]
MAVVPMVRLDDAEPALDAPRRMRPGDAAADLPARHDALVPAHGRALVPTGFAVAIPEGMAGLVLPRSGLALNHGVTLLNTPGLIDSGYRGELKVVMHNTTNEPYQVTRGQRIAQLLVVGVEALTFDLVDELPPGPDDRGSAGFGSSG